MNPDRGPRTTDRRPEGAVARGLWSAVRGPVIALLFLLITSGAAAQTIDDFDHGLAAWSAHPSDGVDLKISEDAGRRGKAMRLDFDFNHHAGYAIARRKVDLDLPSNYEITFWMRAEAPVNNLELKLIDATGDNVWWCNRQNFEYPRTWKEIVTRKRQIAFAWGPIGGGEIKHVASMEIVVTAGTGGKGTVWIDDLRLVPLPPADKNPATFGAWHGRADESRTVDLGKLRELGGLKIEWEPRDLASSFDVEVSRDATRFTRVRHVFSHPAGAELVWLPDVDARYVRIVPIATASKSGWGMRSLVVEPAEWATTANEFFAHVAESAKRGDCPRYLRGEQPYWTIAGADRAKEEALIGEDGNIEPFKSGFSIEPFLRVGSKVITWADATIEHSLERGDLPVFNVTWRAPGVTLTTTSFVSTDNRLYVRYRAETKKAATLYVAVRPFQVNPSTQFLNTPGGVSPIREVALDHGALLINGEHSIIPTTNPERIAASTFDDGDIVDSFRRGAVGSVILSRRSRGGRVGERRSAAKDPVPGGWSGGDRSTTPSALRDDFGYASAALEYALKPGENVVDIRVPLDVRESLDRPWDAALANATASWKQKLDRVAIDIPAAPEVANTLRTNIAYILINRDGAALQPGSRSYERSWIRDGSLIASVLLRLGLPEDAKAFAEWYAPYQYPDGKVPCCVDSRGADPVPENDSHGELIDLVAEIWRSTHDEAFVRLMWPHVDAAAKYIAKLRSENHGEFEGLLTESISHEGYSAKPMHSYWDDFFGVRGVEDAAELAGVLGLSDRQKELQEQAASFRRDVAASIQRSMAEHHIDYIPGSAELGDFDATSTAIAISPLELTSLLPPDALRATFDRYLEQFRKRREAWRTGTHADGIQDVYTPYELRNVGAFVRLGRRAEANELLDFFMHDRRPAPWNEWAEVVEEHPRTPRFLGDMPHSWVGSDFMRSLLDFFAFDREDGALVIGAGIPEKWVNGSFVHAGPLSTHTGTLDVRISGDAAHAAVTLSGDAHPPGGFVVRSPYDRAIRGVRVNDAPIAAALDAVRVNALPAKVEFFY